MKFTSATCRRIGGSCRETLRPIVPAFAFAAVALLLFLGVNVAIAQAAPVIDGNLDDMITYAQNLQSSHSGFGLYITDKPDAAGNPTQETIYNDLKFIPCPQPQPALGTHWVNGVEIFRHVLAYTPGSTQLYLGIRSEGFIGDSDGNNDPDTSGGGSCNPDDNIVDSAGISGNELYAWNFDLDCDGTAESRIEIHNNAVVGSGLLSGATGTLMFRKNDAVGASGRDLEVQVNLAAPLPGAFNFVNVEANAFDGLSEDRSAGAPLIGIPNIDVSKSATPTSICPNGTTRFTVTINNTGQTELSVVAKDQLPAALSYAGNLQSSCGATLATNVSGLLTFNPVTIAAGATCTISYDVTASAQCFGEASNTVNVVGTFNSACIAKGGHQTVKDSATSTITCTAPGGVDVTASGPASACPNSPITISGTVHNTSQGAETIVVKVNGSQAFSQSVNAGDTVNWSFPTTMPANCTAGQNSSFTVTATATGGCGDVTDDATVNVRCASPPCVNLDINRDLNAACPGDSITFSGTATSCSPDSETVTIAINGTQYRSARIAGNAAYNFSFKLAMPQCTAGNATTFNVLATASNECGTPATQTKSLSVQCNAAPTVSVTAGASIQSGCPNAPVTISGQVTNTGSQSGTFTVTVNGTQVFNSTVGAGQSANYSQQTTLGNCTAGNNVTYTVIASVSNSCGNAQDTKTVNVACNAAPCVQLTADRTPATACPGDSITISGTVKNCAASGSAPVTVTLNGEQIFSQTLTSQQTVNWSRRVAMTQCTGGSQVTWTLVATATGDCPPAATDTKTVSVTCNSAPCVQLLELNSTKTVACPQESLTVYGKVKNCGAQSGTFTVTIGGVQVFNQSLDANATASFARTVNQAQCAAGGNVQYQVHASVTNSCGNNTADGTVTVNCQQAPCVDLTATGPQSSCGNTPITLSGTVKNCGPIAGTYVVKVGDTQAFNQSIAAGQTANWTLQVPFSCSTGQSVSYTVTATVTNDCGTDTETKTVNVLCNASPCVAIDLNAPTVACVGSNVQLCGTVTNCSNTTENIEVHYLQQSQVVSSVAPGQSKAFCFDVRMPACTQGDVLQWTVTAIARNDCGQSEKTAVDETKCKLPEIKVKKAAESVVDDGGIIHYTIIVENPGEAPLSNVVVSDPLCSYSVYNGNANPKPTNAPAIGSNGTVTWTIPTLDKGESMALTFEAKASLSTGGASCPGDVICRNKVTATGTCSGTTDTTPISSSDETATTIRCAVQNCPRSPGFWTQQCAQKGNGSTKFTVVQMKQITARIDDVSTFFNWNADSTFDRFCATVNPAKPMSSRKQAERQFAVLLANYSTDQLNLTPSAGGQLLLDPNTAISCDGFNATTIGALISEIDLKLVSLQNGSEDASVYGQIASCLDKINNGIGIPTIAGCEEGGDDSGSDDARGDKVKLSAAQPNPFTSTTSFSYEVAGQSDVSVIVYNVAGRQVRTLVAQSQAAGKYTITWDGKADDGSNVVRGVYFVRAVVAGQKSPVQRVLYIRDQQ